MAELHAPQRQRLYEQLAQQLVTYISLSAGRATDISRISGGALAGSDRSGASLFPLLTGVGMCLCATVSKAVACR